ncbi:dihydroorotate dehydrogenase electron transfer subunit [Candidatus Thorarchaeota archaeon]|nr:MAG: dihydroorotate dehydrogenase electron transfer subunit [Candidatus Thorarchaeota archaeon]
MNIGELTGNQQSVRISEIIHETPLVRTLRINAGGRTMFQPGQFLMVWIPEVDEIPMSISMQDDSSIALTVLPVGESTRKLCERTPGDWIGIRGPFGSFFHTTASRAFVVGGGVGMAPLRPLVYSLLKKNVEVTLLIGAKTRDELVYYNEFYEKMSSNFKLEAATDDGSFGHKGLATEAAEILLNAHDFDMIYTCGPELMMATLHRLALAHKIPIQASLERFMKCGCGICGTCAIDPTGHLACVDGPVFTGEQLSKFTDFGKFCRDAVGIKKPY